MFKIVTLFKNLDMIVAGFSLVVLVAVTFFGVIMRYLFNDPFIWLQEIQLWTLTWIVFFGGSVAFRNGSHVAIDFFVNRISQGKKYLIELLVLIICIVIMFYLMVNGLKYVIQLYDTERVTDILHVSYSIIYAAFPICCFLIIVNFSSVLIRNILLHKTENRGDL